jgi:predicted amidohydrolase YtcJ
VRGGPCSVYEARLGPERVRAIYAFRKMLDAGVHVAGGSDSPVVPHDPMLGLHACVNAHYESQRLSPLEALQLYTINAAWAASEETSKGDLKVGMNADLAVLNGNPLEIDRAEIQNIAVLLTLKGGRVVHDQLSSPVAA